MKWLRKRFFTWLLKNLDYYRLMNRLTGEYRLDLDLEKSIEASPDITRDIPFFTAQDGVSIVYDDDGTHVLLDSAAGRAIEKRAIERLAAPTMVRGYEKP